MAINFQEQATVDIGRSRIQTADTFSGAAAPTRGSGFEELSKALGKMGVTFDQIEEDYVKKQAAQQEYWVNKVTTDLGGRPATDDDINNILSPVHPRLRAAFTEAYGRKVGVEEVMPYLENMPEAARTNPEEATKFYQGIRNDFRERYKDRPFFASGVLSSVERAINDRMETDSKVRATEYRKTLHEDSANSIDNSVKDGWSGKIDTSLAPDPTRARAIAKTAAAVGIDPRIVYSIVGFETAGTFNPDIRGGSDRDGKRKGQYLGAIQFSPENQKRYGIRPGMTFEEQMEAVTLYLKDTGVKPGMGLADVYAAVLTGRAGNVKGRDINGSVMEHVARMQREFWPKAAKALGMDLDGPTNVAAAQPKTATDASGDAGAVKEGSTTPTTSSNANVPSADPYADITDPRVLAIHHNFRVQEKIEEAKGLSSDADKRRRRDNLAQSLINLAKDTDKLDPKILDSFPKELLTRDLKEKFDVVKKEIESAAITKRRNSIDISNNNRGLAYQEAETRLLKEGQNGYVDPYKFAAFKYKDADGKEVEVRDDKLFDIAQKLNRADRHDPEISMRRRMDAQEVVLNALVTNKADGLRNHPVFKNVVGEDGAVPTMRQLRDAIWDSDLNKADKAVMIGELDKMKNVHAIVYDPMVKANYADQLGTMIKGQIDKQPLLATSASFDAKTRDRITRLPGDIEAFYNRRYLEEYRAWAEKNGSEPTYDAKLAMMRNVTKEARELLTFRLEELAFNKDGKAKQDLIGPDGVNTGAEATANRAQAQATGTTPANAPVLLPRTGNTLVPQPDGTITVVAPGQPVPQTQSQPAQSAPAARPQTPAPAQPVAQAAQPSAEDLINQQVELPPETPQPATQGPPMPTANEIRMQALRDTVQTVVDFVLGGTSVERELKPKLTLQAQEAIKSDKTYLKLKKDYEDWARLDWAQRPKGSDPLGALKAYEMRFVEQYLKDNIPDLGKAPIRTLYDPGVRRSD